MAVSSYIPQTLAEMKKVNQVTAERWIKDNASWVAAMVAKHDSWIKDNAVDLYQAAYDGELDEIEQRDKARDGGTENKLISNYVQIIIDTLVDYMLGKSPIYTVEDPDQDDEETEEREIITEYRKKVMKLLKDKAQGEFSDLLRDMCIGGFGSIIVWVDEKGKIDYSEFVTGIENIRIVLNDAAIRKAITGYSDKLLTLDELNTFLRGRELPPMEAFDAKVTYRDPTNGGKRTTARLLDSKKGVFLMEGDKIGNVQMGPTYENNMEPGIFARTFTMERPLREVVEVVAAGFPKIMYPELIKICTVR